MENTDNDNGSSEVGSRKSRKTSPSLSKPVVVHFVANSTSSENGILSNGACAPYTGMPYELLPTPTSCGAHGRIARRRERELSFVVRSSLVRVAVQLHRRLGPAVGEHVAGAVSKLQKPGGVSASSSGKVCWALHPDQTNPTPRAKGETSPGPASNWAPTGVPRQLVLHGRFCGTATTRQRRTVGGGWLRTRPAWAWPARRTSAITTPRSQRCVEDPAHGTPRLRSRQSSMRCPRDPCRPSGSAPPSLRARPLGRPPPTEDAESCRSNTARRCTHRRGRTRKCSRSRCRGQFA